MDENEVKVEKGEKKGTTITISRDALGLFFTIIAAGLIIVNRLLFAFGVVPTQGLSIFMCLAIYSLAILGIVFVALRDRKFTPSLWLAILVLAVATMGVI